MLGALGEEDVGNPFLDLGEEGEGGEGIPRARARGGEYPGHA